MYTPLDYGIVFSINLIIGKTMHTNLGGGHMHAAPGLLAKEVVEEQGEEV